MGDATRRGGSSMAKGMAADETGAHQAGLRIRRPGMAGPPVCHLRACTRCRRHAASLSRPSGIQVHRRNLFRRGGSFDFRLQFRLVVEARQHMRPHRNPISTEPQTCNSLSSRLVQNVGQATGGPVYLDFAVLYPPEQLVPSAGGCTSPPGSSFQTRLRSWRSSHDCNGAR
jgi:hypothetical protein